MYNISFIIGEIRCSGSSLFLKTRFGVGYILSISKSNVNVIVEPIYQLIKDIINNVTIISSVAGEVIFRLPLDSISKFGELFLKLKNNSSVLMISSYGISLTTLEQVFISLAKEKRIIREDYHKNKNNNSDEDDADALIDEYDDHNDDYFYHIQQFLYRNMIIFGNWMMNIFRFNSCHRVSVETIDNNRDDNNNNNNNSNNNSNINNNNNSGNNNDNSGYDYINDRGDDEVDDDNGGKSLNNIYKRRGQGIDFMKLSIIDEDNIIDAVDEIIEEDRVSGGGGGGGGNSIKQTTTITLSPPSISSSSSSVAAAAAVVVKEKERVNTSFVDVSLNVNNSNNANDEILDEIKINDDDDDSSTDYINKHISKNIIRDNSTDSTINDNTTNNNFNNTDSTTTTNNNNNNNNNKKYQNTPYYHMLIQFYELLKKRYIIASRDMKGIFFQIIFPAVQILCILLILTINVNPAGHTLTLNSSLYEKEVQIIPKVNVAHGLTSLSFNSNSTNDIFNNVEFQFDDINLNLTTLILLNVTFPRFKQFIKDNINANLSIPDEINLQDNNIKLSSLLSQITPQTIQFLNFKSMINRNNEINITFPKNSYKNSLSDDNMIIINSTEDNSTALSHHLLNPDYYTLDRYGAYVFNDIIPLNITIDWSWIQINKNVLGQGIVDLLIATNIINTESSSSSQNKDIINAIFNLFPNDTQRYILPLPSQYTILHNSTSPHAIAAFHGELIQSAYRQCQRSRETYSDDYNTISSSSRSSGGDSDFSDVYQQRRLKTSSIQYLIKNHPLPITLKDTIEIEVILALLTSIFIIVPLCYIPASFVSFVVKERVSKSKHLQIVSSVSPYLYWFATYTWDMILFSFLVLFIILIFFAFGSASKVFIYSYQSTIALTLLLFLYGLSVIPLSYIYSLFFDNFSTAQISIMVINFLTGFVMVLAYYVLINIPKTKSLGQSLVHLFRFFPPYLVGEGLINISTTYYLNVLDGQNINYFAWKVTGRNLTFMTLEAVGYFSIILLTEFSYLYKIIYSIDRYRLSKVLYPPPLLKGNIDEDIIDEQSKVEKLCDKLINYQQQQNTSTSTNINRVSSNYTKLESISKNNTNNTIAYTNDNTVIGNLTGVIELDDIYHDNDENCSINNNDNSKNNEDDKNDRKFVSIRSSEYTRVNENDINNDVEEEKKNDDDVEEEKKHDINNDVEEENKHDIDVEEENKNDSKEGDEKKNETCDNDNDNNTKKCVLLIKDLIKTYPPSILCGNEAKYAVRGISLACYAGERFGLLGINGAGKTTTLSILTG